MKFLRHLLGITKPDKEKNQCLRQKTGAQHIVKEIKQYQKMWLKHAQRMDTFEEAGAHHQEYIKLYLQPLVQIILSGKQASSNVTK